MFHRYETSRTYDVKLHGRVNLLSDNCFREMSLKCSLLGYYTVNLLKKKRNLLYRRNQSVPRSKHFLLRL